MSLTHTRPEKSEAMSRLVYALRNSITDGVQLDGLNIAEAINATAHLTASLLVGAYENKNREIVLSSLPDVVRAYYPEWEKIYAANGHKTDHH